MGLLVTQFIFSLFSFRYSKMQHRLFTSLMRYYSTCHYCSKVGCAVSLMSVCGLLSLVEME